MSGGWFLKVLFMCGVISRRLFFFFSEVVFYRVLNSLGGCFYIVVLRMGWVDFGRDFR